MEKQFTTRPAKLENTVIGLAIFTQAVQMIVIIAIASVV
jgi:hypothetical protein